MSLHTKVKEIEDFREKVKALEHTRVPLWSLEQLSEYINWTLQQLSPLQVGDRAELFRDLEIGTDRGWYTHRNNLNMGRKGAITEVDWKDGKFNYVWEPENQTWMHPHTHEELPVDRPYQFMISQDYLRPTSISEGLSDDAGAQYAKKVVGFDGYKNYLKDLKQPDGSNDVSLFPIEDKTGQKAQRADIHWILAEAFRAGASGKT